MTNPNNALGTNAALGGRTSVDAFNDAISSLTRGVVSGFAVTPSSAMTLNVGGTAGVRDVAVAVSPNGNRVSVDNRTTSPIKVTMAVASASSARIDAIVAYVNSPSQVTETTPDNPTACGIIPVSGTTSAQPTDSAIRTAISADGGTGSTAYYAIIAIVRLAANTTTITSNMITMQKSRIADSLVTNNSIADKAIKSGKVDWATLKTGKPTEVGSGTASRTITASSAGFMFINMACAFEQYCEVYLNGTLLGSSKSGGTSTFTWLQTTVFVAKGDVVRIKTSDNGGNAQITGVLFVPIS